MNISFFHTQQQIRDRTKFVTRRLGWLWLVMAVRRGEHPILQPIVKGQGLKPGQRVERIGGPIRVIYARREPLKALLCGGMAKREVILEGFPDLTPKQFVEMYCTSFRCEPKDKVTRIGFEYL